MVGHLVSETCLIRVSLQHQFIRESIRKNCSWKKYNPSCIMLSASGEVDTQYVPALEHVNLNITGNTN